MIHRVVVSLEVPDEEEVSPTEASSAVEGLLRYTLQHGTTWELRSVLPLRPPVAR
jgi:hypothetical protein